VKNLNENELLNRLSYRWEKITHAKITSPDYEVWGRAREWEYHQAACLLSGMTPLAKAYFDILISHQSPLDNVHWIAYYPLTPQDRTRLINIDRLLKTLIPNTKQTLRPQALLAQCKAHANITHAIPAALVAVVEQLSPHLSLNLPHVLTQLELNPSILIDIAKYKKNRESDRFTTPTEPVTPSSPLITQKPTETALEICKRLYPLQLSERWEQADGFSLHEVILLYYGIDPEAGYPKHLPGQLISEEDKEFIDYFNCHCFGDHHFLLTQIDEKQIGALLRLSIQAGNLIFNQLLKRPRL
jgi:hypothetical protein